MCITRALALEIVNMLCDVWPEVNYNFQFYCVTKGSRMDSYKVRKQKFEFPYVTMLNSFLTIVVYNKTVICNQDKLF